MCFNWPSLNTLDSVLQYVGPLPASCPCSTTHQSLRGLSTKGGFKSFFAQSLGPRFWPASLARCKTPSFTVPLGMEFLVVPSSSAGTISSGGKVPYGFALSAAPESVAALHEAWKGNTLTRSILRDYSSARLDSCILILPFVSWLQVSGLAALPWCSRRFWVFLVPCFFCSCFRSSCSWPSRFSQFFHWWQLSSLSRHRVARFYSFPSREFFESHWIARVARGAALVDVEQGVPLAPSPGSSSSTTKRKSPLEPDARAGRACTVLDANWRAGFDTGHWALEYILTVTSDFAIASGPW